MTPEKPGAMPDEIYVLTDSGSTGFWTEKKIEHNALDLSDFTKYIRAHPEPLIENHGFILGKPTDAMFNIAGDHFEGDETGELHEKFSINDGVETREVVSDTRKQPDAALEALDMIEHHFHVRGGKGVVYKYIVRVRSALQARVVDWLPMEELTNPDQWAFVLFQESVYHQTSYSMRWCKLHEIEGIQNRQAETMDSVQAIGWRSEKMGEWHPQGLVIKKGGENG